MLPDGGPAMRRFFNFFKKSVLLDKVPQQSEAELRDAFRKRYTLFRSLLTANNNALQAMADLERLYYSGESYRMAVIRARVTTILVNVYKMVRNLQAMSNGRYSELEAIFDKISQQLEKIVEKKPVPPHGEYILTLAETRGRDRGLVGEKMANLAEISRLPGISVPAGFIVTAAATRHFLTADHFAEINRRLQVLDPEDLDALYQGCAGIQSLINAVPLPGDLEERLLMHYSRLEKAAVPGVRVALRSSALGEDSGMISFAGMYRTELNVDRQGLFAAYKKVIAGKYGASAVAYRRRRGYRHEDIEMCVGCMVMVDAVVSGVTYSRDPGDQRREVLRINCTAGAGKGVVDGTNLVDLFLLDRNSPFPVIHRELRQEGGPLSAVPADLPPSLDDGQLRQLAETALQLEKHFGQPQDIEWSFDRQGTLQILQSRPLQVAATDEQEKKEDLAGEEQIGEPPLLRGGVCASRGIACGKVFPVDSTESMRRFPQGAVLVLSQPLPEWAPLLNRAVALIAEHGSEAGHLATVSREFGLPAIFGLTRAMEYLEEGREVTVDATAEAVYAGCREDLLKKAAPHKDIMAGSPVQRLLGEAMALITPLNLTDPASSQFKPSWCETLHDITRFCHEKSVSAMFNFGEQFQFDKSKAKRLVGDVPLEWWVINLADGFSAAARDEDKAIHISDIVSVPMLAIWRGISAYSWEGPPAVSVRGFGSIIFQSAMRPELDPAVASTLTTKNYFLISKNFCNLSVRLGYHYAMIEAFLSDLLTENYVTFRFKGGAADHNRRAVRTRLLADILERHDFEIELNGDTLLARIKKRSADYLEARLQVLGYLTLHTRQLDMVMDQPAMVAQYRNRFNREIATMLGRVEPPRGEDHGTTPESAAGR